MIAFESILNAINILVVEPKDSKKPISTLPVLSEPTENFIIHLQDEIVLNQPNVMELESYDIIVISGRESTNEIYNQIVTRFCTKYSYIPIIIIIDDPNEEEILSYLSLGIQDVLGANDTCVTLERFRLKVLSAISRQLKSRIVTESDDLYKVMFEYSLDVVLLMSDKGDLLYTSPNIKSVLGYSLHETIGKNVYQYLNNNDATEIQALMSNSVLGDSKPTAKRVKMVAHNSDWIDMDLTIRNMTDDPKVGCYVVNCHVSLNM